MIVFSTMADPQPPAGNGESSELTQTGARAFTSTLVGLTAWWAWRGRLSLRPSLRVRNRGHPLRQSTDSVERRAARVSIPGAAWSCKKVSQGLAVTTGR